MIYYPNKLLDSARLLPDIQADRAVVAIYKSKNRDKIRAYLSDMEFNAETLPAYAPKALHTLWELVKDPSDKLNDSKTIATRFFEKNKPEVLSMLGVYALPYCYAAADGARVLILSERIGSDTYQRLNETGQFLLNVMDPLAFEPNGKGLLSIFKVRLLHATIRYHILAKGKWDVEAWGTPVNQEDMAGTNLAFSLIVLRGLRKIGVSISEKEFEAYLAYWSAIGQKLGIIPELLPANGKQAFYLDKAIVTRHHKPSEQGKKLTQSLLASYEKDIPVSFPKGYMNSYMRQMLGDTLANTLGIPEANWTGNLIKGLNVVRATGSYFFGKALLPTDVAELQSESRLDTFGLPLYVGSR